MQLHVTCTCDMGMLLASLNGLFAQKPDSGGACLLGARYWHEAVVMCSIRCYTSSLCQWLTLWPSAWMDQPSQSFRQVAAVVMICGLCQLPQWNDDHCRAHCDVPCDKKSISACNAKLAACYHTLNSMLVYVNHTTHQQRDACRV